jgi:hypothetical protein
MTETPLDQQQNGLIALIDASKNANTPLTLLQTLHDTGFVAQGAATNFVVERGLTLPKQVDWAFEENVWAGQKSGNAAVAPQSSANRYTCLIMQQQAVKLFKRRVSMTVPLPNVDEQITQPLVLASMVGFGTPQAVPDTLLARSTQFVDENNLQLSSAKKTTLWNGQRLQLVAQQYAQFRNLPKNAVVTSNAEMSAGQIASSRLKANLLTWTIKKVPKLLLRDDDPFWAMFIDELEPGNILSVAGGQIDKNIYDHLLGVVHQLDAPSAKDSGFVLLIFERDNLQNGAEDLVLKREIRRYKSVTEVANRRTENLGQLSEKPWTGENALSKIPPDLITIKYIIDKPNEDYSWSKLKILPGKKVMSLFSYVGKVLSASDMHIWVNKVERWIKDERKKTVDDFMPPTPKKLQALHTASGFDTNPWKAGWELGERFPKGNPLSQNEYDFIKAMSGKDSAVNLSDEQKEFARLWLSAAGIFPIDEAVAYLKAHKFYAWLKLEASYRLLLSTIAWQKYSEWNLSEKEVKDTPAWRLGRSMEAGQLKRLKKDQNRFAKLVEELDADIVGEWFKTLVNASNKVVGEDSKKGEVDLDLLTKQVINAGALKDVPLNYRKVFVNDFTEQDLQSPKAAILKGASGSSDPSIVLAHHTKANKILVKILLLLHAGLKLYNFKTKKYETYPGSIVRALSHGGRVNIRMPQVTSLPATTGESVKRRAKAAKKSVTSKFTSRKNESQATENTDPQPYDLTDWLGVTTKGHLIYLGPAFSRPFGTHHHEIGKNKDGQAGTGSFREVGGSNAALANKFNTRTWGMNVSVGGIGQRDYNGDVIIPDGAHGHVFFSYRPPEAKQDGGVMIGIETTGPGASSLVGYHHGPESTEATANPESSFGGLKKDKVGDGYTPKAVLKGSATTVTKKLTETVYDTTTYTRKTTKIGKETSDVEDEETRARYIDLKTLGENGNWLDYIKKYEQAFDALVARDGVAVAYRDLVTNGEKLKAEVAKQTRVTPSDSADRLAKSAEKLTQVTALVTNAADAAVPLIDATSKSAVANAKTSLLAHRYQFAVTALNQPVVSTQDTIVSLRQLPFNQTKGNQNFPQLEATHAKAAEINGDPTQFIYRSLVYQAALVRWLHPLGAAKATPQAILPLSGSGVSYGMSCNVQLLRQAIAAGANQGQGAYLTRIAAHLRVREQDLVKFLTESNLGKLQPDSGLLQEIDVVLLESSFAFDSSSIQFSLTANSVENEQDENPIYEIEDIFANQSLVNFLRTIDPAQDGSKPNPALDALRMRLRMTDLVKAPDNAYKAGYVLANPATNDDIITDSIVDIYAAYARTITTNFNAAQSVENLPTQTRNRAQAVVEPNVQQMIDDAELVVPPVVLLNL